MGIQHLLCPVKVALSGKGSSTQGKDERLRIKRQVFIFFTGKFYVLNIHQPLKKR